MNNIKEMLEACNFPTEGRRIMLARHTLTDEPPCIINCVKGNPDVFAEWQSVQGAGSWGMQFKHCDFVMSFCKIDGDRARFVGVYRNESGDMPDMFDVARLPERLADAYREKIRGEESRGETVERFLFQLPKVENTFADLEGRVIVSSRGKIKWVDEYNSNESPAILEITRESVAPFCDQ